METSDLKDLFSQLKLAFFPYKENNFRPLLLQRQFLIYYVMIFLVLKLIIFPFYYLFPKTSFFAEVVSSTLIELANQDRKSLGLAALKVNPVLSQAAMQKAQDMLANDYFSHTSPAGVTPWHWFKKNGYTYLAAGENLAIGFLDSSEVETAWKNSPSHRDNLLSSNFKEVGIAVVQGEFQGKETTLVVQFFGNPVVKPVAITVQTKPAQTASPKPSPQTKPETPSPTPINILGQEETPQESLAVDPLAGKQELNLPAEIVAFGVAKYDKFASRFITFLLLFLVGSLSFNLFVNWIEGIKSKELIFSTALFIFLFFVSNFLDKQSIINLIPHNLVI